MNWIQLWENGPKFAEYNIGAENNKAEDYGGYYCWGNTAEQSSTWTGQAGTDDIATNLWGSKWRMPTSAELEGLLTNCDVAWTNVGDVYGCKFTGNGDYTSNSVFLPAAGYCYYYGDVFDQGDLGYYWSSTPVGTTQARNLLFSSDSQGVDDIDRFIGSSVRAVLAE